MDKTGRSKPRPFQVTRLMPDCSFMDLLNVPRMPSSMASAPARSPSRDHWQVEYPAVKRYLGKAGSISMTMSTQATATTRCACGGGNGSILCITNPRGSPLVTLMAPSSLLFLMGTCGSGRHGTISYLSSPGAQTLGSGMVSMSSTRKIMASTPPLSRLADRSTVAAGTRNGSGTSS